MADDANALNETIAFRTVPYLEQKLDVTYRDDGAILLRNGQPLRPAPDHMLHPLVYWAAMTPDRVALAQRDPVDANAPGWQTLTYSELLDKVRRLAQSFLEMGLGPDAPIMILSRNSIEHAIVNYAALWVGAPVCPITPAYSLLSQDHERLKYAMELLEPKAVYAEDGTAFERAFNSIATPSLKIITQRNKPNSVGEYAALGELLNAEAGPDVTEAYNRLRGEGVAKYLLTSGSTGQPKAVINTHGMIASDVKMIRSVWDTERMATTGEHHQVMVSFLPWSHTFGGNAILHNMLDWGGTLYIDWGAPTPDRVGEMFRNLKEVSPTQHTTVPAAWAALATELERDQALADVFFKRLNVMSYGGAAMGQDIYERIQKVAIATTGERISLSAGYGATETAPTTSNVHWANDTMGLIGLPLPGCDMKLAPVGEKYECRVKGPHITPGYYKDPKKTAEAFDEEGYYKLGDAVKFKDPDNPNKGLAFDGRIAEEFKLISGTWVSAGNVRVNAVATVDGALSDAVVCGLNQNYIALLGFLNPIFCSRLTNGEVGDDLVALARNETVRQNIVEGLKAYNKANPNSASRVAKILLLTEPPNADQGEITDKGYLNQSRIQTRRAAEVDRLFVEHPDPEVIVL